MRTRMAMLLPTLFLLSACTVVPSGIVDHFVPPQAQPVAQAQRVACAPGENTSTNTTGQPVADQDQVLLPCAVETLTGAVAGTVAGSRNALPPPQRRSSARRLPFLSPRR